jgi:hypothetical protein
MGKNKNKDWSNVGEGKEAPDLPKGIPTLVLTAYAFNKLCYYAAMSQKDEVSCFGVATDPDNLLRVTEIYLPKQYVSPARTDMDDDAVADMFGELGKAGLAPTQFARIWIHTHPFGETIAPTPSMIDYDTCRQVFGDCDWFVMLIKGPKLFTCHLYIMGQVPVQLALPVSVDYTNPGLPGSIIKRWTTAFLDGVLPKEAQNKTTTIVTQEVDGNVKSEGGKPHTVPLGSNDASSGQPGGGGNIKAGSPIVGIGHPCFNCLNTYRPSIDVCKSCPKFVYLVISTGDC